MNFIHFLMDHYVMIVELIGLWAMIGVGVHINPRTVRTTRLVILLIVMEAIVYALERWTQTFETLNTARPLLTATLYLIHPVILLMMTEMLAPSSSISSRWWAWIPVLVCAPVFYTSQWTRLVFYFSESNHYHGTDLLGHLPYALFALYLLYLIVCFWRRFSRYDSRIRAGILYVAIAAAVGVGLYLVTDVETDYSTILASVLVVVYLFVYMHRSKIDLLTGLMNRPCFFHDIQPFYPRVTGIASVDMNELKWINDSQGHEAGDVAIRAVADCLTVTRGSHKYVYRVGGDEFIILYLGKTEEEITADIAKMRECLAKTPYVCAFGYAMKGDRALADLLREADHEMYEDKAALKRAVLEQGGQLHRRGDDA